MTGLIYKRIDWVDTIKAICIFSVVINHSPFPQSLFHVDFYFLVGFFFCSGYVFRDEYSIRKRIAKLADSVIIPYLILTPVAYFLNKVHLYTLLQDPVHTLTSFVYNLILGYNFWFLPCLVSIEVIYSILTRITRRIDWGLSVFCLFIFLSGAINDSKLPWHLDTAVYGLIFFCLGHIVKNINIPYSPSYEKLGGAVLVGTFFVYLSNTLFPLTPFNTSLNRFTFNWIIISMNYLAIPVLILLSISIKSNGFIKYLGQNSLIIYIFNVCPMGIIQKLLFNWVNNTVFYNSFSGILFSFIIVLTLYPFVKIIKKYAGWTCGKSQMFQRYMLKDNSI